MFHKLAPGKGMFLKPSLVIYSLCAIIILSVYGNYFDFNVYGHDEVHYYQNFRFKLIEEGRWLNYLLHDVLRAIPLHVWSIALVATAFLFFYLLLADTNISKVVCALFATCSVSSIPFVSQSLWPATLFPSMFSLLFLLNIKDKIGYKKTYILSGILLFGGLQNLYFITPLLFMSSFLSSNNSLKSIFRHGLWWVAGCLVGITTSLVMVFVITGQIGLEVAEWRQTKPVHDLHSAINNLTYIIGSFNKHFDDLTNQFGRYTYYILLFLAALLNFRLSHQYIYTLLILIAVAVSYFAFSLPLSPVIETRTLLPLYLAMSLSLVVFSSVRFFTWVNIFNLFILCIVNLINASTYMNRHQEITDHYYYSIYRTLDRDANQYTSIVLKGTLPAQHPYAYFFNSAPQMHSVVHALGASSYWDCRESSLDQRCKNELNLVVKNATAMDGGELSLLVDEDQNIAVLEFSPHNSRSSDPEKLRSSYRSSDGRL